MAATEKEQLELVFLVDSIDDWNVTDEAGNPHVVYASDDLPEYCEADYEDRYEVAYKTVYANLLYHPNGPHKEFTDANGSRWDFVASFASSGEASCPIGDAIKAFDDGGATDRPEEPDVCPYCESPKGEHGQVYIGEGWHEVIYRHRVYVWDTDTFDTEDEVVEAALQVLDEVGELRFQGKRFLFSVTLVAADE